MRTCCRDGLYAALSAAVAGLEKTPQKCRRPRITEIGKPHRRRHDVNTKIGRLIRVATSKIEAWRGMRMLYQIDDRMLADIGLTRGGLESAVRGGQRRSS
jgi:uncharacterized protein YjiS (DUF1127 family)